MRQNTLPLCPAGNKSLLRFRRASAVASLCGLLLWPATWAQGQTAGGAPPQPQAESALEAGKTVAREIKGGEAHHYRITLRRGEFLRSVTTSQGVDVSATLYGPDGEKLLAADLLKYPGPEPVSFVAEKAGAYRLEVGGSGPALLRGRYELTSETRATADEADKARAAAERLLSDASALEREGAKESLARAVEKYVEAGRQWRALGDKFWEAYALHYSGRATSNLGENQRALDYYNQALSLRRAAGDRVGEAATLRNIGSAYDDLGEKRKALEFYNQALPIHRAVGDRGGEAAALNNMSVVYNAFGEKQKALEFYNLALTIYRAIGDRATEAIVLGNVGVVYADLGEREKALELYNQSLPLLRAAGNRRVEATTLNNIGNLYSSLGEKQKALEFYNLSLPLLRAVGNRKGEADTLLNIGGGYNDLGDHQKALDAYNLALPLSRAVGDRLGEAIALHNTGVAYNSLGEKQKALEFYNQALLLYRGIGDKAREADTLKSIASAYSDLGEKQKALEFGRQSVELRRAIGDQMGEAYALISLGNFHHSAGEPEKARECYAQALSAGRGTKNRSNEADILATIGNDYFSRGGHEDALNYYRSALEIRRELKEKKFESGTLENIGNTYKALSQPEKAVESYEQAMALSLESGDAQGYRRSLESRSSVLYKFAQYERAAESYKQLLKISRDQKDVRRVAVSLINLGLTYRQLNQPEEGRNQLEQALIVTRELNDHGLEISTLTNLAGCYGDLNQTEQALKLLEQALIIAKEAKDKGSELSVYEGRGQLYLFKLYNYSEAITNIEAMLEIATATKIRYSEGAALSLLGKVYRRVHQYEMSLKCYGRALAIDRELKDRQGEAIDLVNIGEVYDKLSLYAEALEHKLQALAITRALNYEDPELLVSIGLTYAELGQLDKSLEFEEKALSVSRAKKDRRTEASALDNLAYNYMFKLKRPDKALPYAEEAVRIARATGDRIREAYARCHLADIYKALNNNQKAVEQLTEAWVFARAANDINGEGEVLGTLMTLQAKLNQFGAAILSGKMAVNAFQQVRALNLKLDKEAQKSLLKSKEENYRELADLLIAQGRLPEAQQVLAMLKEEEFFDYVRRDGAEAGDLTARATLSPEEGALQAEYLKLADQVTLLGKQRGELSAKKGRTDAEEQLLGRLEDQLAVASDQFNKFLEGLQVKLGKTTAQGARVDAVRDALGMQETLRELGDGAVLIYTLVGEDRYRTMLVTPDTQQAYENPIKAADLARKVLAFREALQNPKSDPDALARDLYEVLVGPKLAHDLEQAGAKTLMWSLDGVLRYLPVAALKDGAGKYLVESYRSVIFTPASSTRLKDPVAARWTGLGVGVSKGKEVLMPGENSRLIFMPLPSVPRELRSIISDKSEAETGGGGLLEGRVMLDESFTKDSLRAALRQKYPLVHIASHFRFQPGNEAASFLLLGGADEQGSKLTVEEIKRVRFEGVDLLTLSACETALGGEKANGVEVESFGVLAQRQGAEAVMATLWSVADVSTPLIMREFYSLRQSKPGRTKAEALQQAQLALLKGSVKPPDAWKEGRGFGNILNLGADRKPAFAHPYFWAPFILIGNWK